MAKPADFLETLAGDGSLQEGRKFNHSDVDGLDPLRTGSVRMYRHLYGPVALEQIVFGAGVFRRIFNGRGAYTEYFGIPPRPKITSQHLRVLSNTLMNVVWDYKDPSTMLVWPMESTNIVLGHSYGEIEQIMRRREDYFFITRYLDLTKRAVERTEMQTPPAFIDVGFPATYKAYLWSTNNARPFCDIAATQHVQNHGLFDSAPNTRRELVERVDWLLKNILIDYDAWYIKEDVRERAMQARKAHKPDASSPYRI